MGLLINQSSSKSTRLYERKATHVEQRWEPRVSLKGKVYIYDVLRSSTGTLRDISGKGFRAAGIKCNVGESKSLLIDFQPFIKADPVLVVARCRWAETRGHSRKYITAGFEILEISDSDSEVLRSLIESLRGRPPKTARDPERVTCQELPLQGRADDGEVTRKRTVKTRDIAEDIRSGTNDTLLMKKYELTRTQLDCILMRLMQHRYRYRFRTERAPSNAYEHSRIMQNIR